MRVIRNNKSGSDGMYIGYVNANSGITRIFGGGASSGEFIKYANYSYDPGSLRAPIFYDSDNTAYYVDPASTSVLNAVQGSNFFDSVGTYNVNLGSGGSEGRGVVAGYSGGSYGGIGFNVRHTTTGGVYIAPSGDTANYITFNQGFTFQGAGTGAAGRTLSFSTLATLNNSAILTVTGDVRAPIFYDSNNTGYYVDPAGNSVLSGAAVYNIWYFYSNQNTSGTNPPLQAYSNNSSGAIMSFHRGGVYAVNMGLDSDNVFRIGGWSAPNSLWQLDMSGNSTFANSDRAPIFYDSQNTAFYFDGASTTNINVLAGNGKDIFNTDDSYLRINQAVNFSNGIWCGNSNRLGGTAYIAAGSNGGTTSSRVYIYGGTYNGTNVIYLDGSNGIIAAAGDMRAPVFYDLNNTGYYADLAASGDSIRAAGNIVAYYSDERLKKHLGKIENALEKVDQLEGFYYEANEVAQKLGYKAKREVGVSAQAVQRVLPEIVTDAPISANYLTIDYERLVPLLIEAIKELKGEVETLKSRLH
jgi:hypothetical protein